MRQLWCVMMGVIAAVRICLMREMTSKVRIVVRQTRESFSKMKDPPGQNLIQTPRQHRLLQERREQLFLLQLLQRETPARTIVIGVIGGLAGLALVVLGIRLVMIKRDVRADLAARDSAALKLPSMINYVNLGWGPCEAPTYADEYTREELHGEVIERPQLDGNQRLEKG